MKIDLKKKILEIVVENAYTKQSEKTIEQKKKNITFRQKLHEKTFLKQQKSLKKKVL